MATVDLLLFEAHAPEGVSADTVFGGLPSIGPDFAWPHCATCGGAMQFLAQLRPPQEVRLLLIFMCANDPGLCDEWDADGGGNAVRVGAVDGLSLAIAPPEGRAVRATRHGARIEHVDAPDYDGARADWAGRQPERAREILGQFGGAPSWIQGDETPHCETCGERMTLTAQMEQGTDPATELNFGGGCGYVFSCAAHPASAKFLWQN